MQLARLESERAVFLGPVRRAGHERLFLDIMLRDKTSFDLIDQLDQLGERAPQIVFVTSEKDYAIRAFQYNATHYIVKPAAPCEVVTAVDKAIATIQIKRQAAAADRTIASEKIRDIIAVSSLDRIDLIKKEDVMYMSGDGRYTQIYIANGKKILTGRKIGDYEKVLDHGMFFRTHRSFIINMQYVARINKREGFYCEMVNGQTVPISKRKQDEFSRFLRVKD